VAGEDSCMEYHRKRKTYKEDPFFMPWWVSAVALILSNILILVIIPWWFSGDRISGVLGTDLQAGIVQVMPKVNIFFSIVFGFTLIISGGREIVARFKYRR
jgi:hypothetical protein